MYSYIFDLGSVLVNYDGMKVIKRLEEISGVESSLIEPLFRHELVYQVETNRISSEEFFKLHVKKIIDNITYDKWIEAFMDIFSPNLPAIELLHYIKRKSRKTYILSNLAEFDKIALEKKIEGIFQYCDYNFFSYELGFHKPERQIYEAVYNKIGEKPENSVFFDDLPQNIEGAKKAGMIGILYSNENIDKIYEEINRLENWK